MTVEKYVPYSTEVDSVQDAFRFIMEHLDELRYGVSIGGDVG